MTADLTELLQSGSIGVDRREIKSSSVEDSDEEQSGTH